MDIDGSSDGAADDANIDPADQIESDEFEPDHLDEDGGFTTVGDDDGSDNSDEEDEFFDADESRTAHLLNGTEASRLCGHLV